MVHVLPRHKLTDPQGVDRALKQKLIRQEDIIELWKLLLYKAHETSDLAKLVKTQLGQRKVGDLISTHLKAVIKEAKRQIKSAQTLELSAEVSVSPISYAVLVADSLRMLTIYRCSSF